MDRHQCISEVLSERWVASREYTCSCILPSGRHCVVMATSDLQRHWSPDKGGRRATNSIMLGGHQQVCGGSLDVSVANIKAFQQQLAVIENCLSDACEPKLTTRL